MFCVRECPQKGAGKDIGGNWRGRREEGEWRVLKLSRGPKNNTPAPRVVFGVPPFFASGLFGCVCRRGVGLGSVGGLVRETERVSSASIFYAVIYAFAFYLYVGIYVARRLKMSV